MEDIKASLAMYFVMIDRCVDDEDKTDPRLLYDTSWRFQALEEVEAWSLSMISFMHDIQFRFKFKKNEIFLKLTMAERVKVVEFLNEDLIQVKCMTSGILIRPEDVYHFIVILPSKQIPFILLYFLESLEPTKYRGEIKHVEAKIDKGEYKEQDESHAVGKRLCTKVNSLLQDFSVIRGKLEAQRAFASLRSVSRERRPPGPSQGSVDTRGAGPASGRAKPRRQSASVGGRPNRSSPLASSSVRQPTTATSQVSEVAEASLGEAMNKVPSSYEPQKKAYFKHITVVYKKFWSECEDAYIFGVDAKKELSINKMVDAPAEYNIRSREDKLVDVMVIYLLNLPDRKACQMLCVMPTNRIEKPTSWAKIEDGEFYIINGQHSVSACRLITQMGSGADEDVKNDFRVWSCFIVWSSDAEILRSISAYYNRINHFQMIQPSWTTNILGARTVWVSMGSPENPSQITTEGTTAARRVQDVQSQTRRFKVRQSYRVDLMCELWLAEPEISLSRVDLISCSYEKSEVLCKQY